MVLAEVLFSASGILGIPSVLRFRDKPEKPVCIINTAVSSLQAN